MSVILTPEIEALIRERVVSGHYDDASQVIREALQLLEDRDRLRRLRSELAIGLDQIERGATVPYTPDFMERLKREAAEQVRSGQPI